MVVDCRVSGIRRSWKIGVMRASEIILSIELSESNVLTSGKVRSDHIPSTTATEFQIKFIMQSGSY